jgi:hypothetical protein
MPSVKIPELNREVYETVVKSIYADPKKASIREIIANAVDANKDNKATKPVIVTFNYDSTIVRDFGTGMSPSIIADIYGSMYQSTKRATDEDEITDRDGEFGIGSKAPYGVLYDLEQKNIRNIRIATSATADHFWPYEIDYYLVKTIYDGVAYMYIMYLSEQGIPSYDLIDSKETDEESGTEVSLPFAYNLTSNINVMDGDTEELVKVLVPFYVHNQNATTIDIQGTNTLFIEQLKSVLDGVFNYKNLYFIDYNMLDRQNKINDKAFSVKYKNIIYPFEGWGLSNYCITASKHKPYFNIDVSSLNKKLSVNRSRDRIDMEYAEEEQINDEALSTYTELFDKVRDFVSSLVTSSSITNLIKLNYVMKQIIDCGVTQTYSPTLSCHIETLINKKVLPKTYRYKNEFQTLIDIFKIKKPEEAFDIAELTSGIDRDLAGKILDAYGFCFIPQFDRIFNTIESESEKKLKHLYDVGAINRQVSNAEKSEEADKVRYFYDSLSNFKRALKGYLGSSNCVFIFKDMKKSFKLPCGLIHYDDELTFDKAYLIEYEGNEHVYKTLIDEGVRTVVKVSELQEKYSETIELIKEDRKDQKRNKVHKRIGGIYRFNKMTQGSYDYEIQPATKRTVMSDVLLECTESVDSVYVLKLNDKSASINATTLDGKNVSIDFKVKFFDNDTWKEFSGVITVTDSIGQTLHTKNISDADITKLLPKDTIIMVCDENKYDKIVDYINNDNIYSFNDYIIDRIKTTSLKVQEPVTVTSIRENIDLLKDKLNSNIDETDKNGRDAIAVNNQTYNCCTTLLHHLRTHGFLEIESNISSTASDHFEKVMIDVSDISSNIENIDIADEMFKKLLDRPLARAMIRSINMSSVRIESEEVVDQLINHLVDQAGVRNILNSYLTK